MTASPRRVLLAIGDSWAAADGPVPMVPFEKASPQAGVRRHARGLVGPA